MFVKGQSGNPNGRPKKDTLEKKTNRQIREEELLALCRKFKPLQTKAIQAAVKIIDDKEANDANKLKAAALIIATYKQLLESTFDHRYDEDAAEEVQQNNAPIFSLKVIGEEEEKAA